ncbi:MAG: glycosyltransferase family 4 protein [Gammaproteobacteria bacterium]|nr:glycosyltransferase family 4 protein [Pseudomonadales bacterium]
MTDAKSDNHLDHKKLNVLFVSHTPNLTGGADFCLKEILENIDREKVSPHVVLPKNTATAKSGFVNFLSEHEIPFSLSEIIHWIDYSSYGKVSRRRLILRFFRTLPARIVSFVKIVNQNKIDLIYTNTVTVVEGALAAKITGKPHIWHIHEAISGNNDLLPIFPEKWHRRVIDCLSNKKIFPSSYLAFQVYQFYKGSEKSIIVPNGVDISRFKPDKTARSWLSKLIEIADSTNRIVSVGNLTESKRMDDYIRAVALSESARGKCVFIIIGSGKSQKRDSLIALSKQLGVFDKVKIISWSGQIEKIIAGSDVLVITSGQETFGRTAIEAMACGVPVVSTDCGGPGEIIDHGETGLLTPVGSPEQTAAAIDRLMLDPDYADSIADKALNKVKESYDLRTYVAQIEKIIVVFKST